MPVCLIMALRGVLAVAEPSRPVACPMMGVTSLVPVLIVMAFVGFTFLCLVILALQGHEKEEETERASATEGTESEESNPLPEESQKPEEPAGFSGHPELEDADNALLQEVADYSGDGRVETVIGQPAAFEAACFDYLRHMSVWAEQGEWSEALGRIDSIREKLGLDPSPDVHAYETQKLQPGQKIWFTVEVQGQEFGVEGKVGRQTGKNFLSLVDLEPIDSRFNGRECQVYVMRDHRRFGFQSELFEVNEAGQWCLAAHAPELENEERRRSYRMMVMGPIRCRKENSSPERWNKAVLIDISAHGLGIICDADFRQGDRVIFTLCPKEYLKAEEPEKRYEIDLEPRDLVGSIRRIRKNQGKKRYHLELGEVKPQTRDYLYQLVRVMELDGLSKIEGSDQ